MPGRGVLAALLLAAVAHGRINVVSLPDRDTVQLTIYNAVDLTLVKETRHLTLKKGLNKLEFSWANTLIDPTSLELRVLTAADQVEVLDASRPPRAPSTLEWRLQSEFAGEAVVEVRYFTSGITWAADYVAEAARDESALTLSGAVKVTNRSGEDYENAQVRLVVGNIRLVEQITQLARDRLADGKKEPLATTLMFMDSDSDFLRTDAYYALNGAVQKLELEDLNRGMNRKEIKREGLSEYFLYTVEGRETIPTGWSKRLPSFTTDDVPVTSHYKFERETWGDRVMRFYRLTNSAAAKLGREPLPDGAVKAFRRVNGEGLLAFTGATRVKYIPVNEVVELELGADREVQVRPTLMNWEKLNVRFNNQGDVDGWTVRETWQVEMQHSRDIPVTLDVRRNFSGDWKLDSAASHENVDATKVKFLIPLRPREQSSLTYTLTTQHGSNATK